MVDSGESAAVTMRRDALVIAIAGAVAAGVDAYVHMRFKEGYGHQASKDHAIEDAREAAEEWLDG